MKKLSKIMSLVLTLVVVLSLALAACTKNNANSWKSDETNHWHEDEEGNKTDEAAHVYDSDTDAECNVCGYKRTVEDNGDNKEKTVIKNVLMWVSETTGVKELTLEQVKAFNSTNDTYTIDIDTLTIEGVSEANSASTMITDVETGADIFCFAQDQTSRLVQAGALNTLGKKATEFVETNNDSGAVKAATSGENVVAYPLTSDNGYFLIYDKRVITDESHLDSLENLIADCQAAGKTFSMEIDTSAWYIASFFFAVGCTSEWTYSSDGKTIESVADDWNSDKGVIAMKAIQKLEKLSVDEYVSSSAANQFSAATACGCLVSGTWAVDAVVEAIGEENVGYADLPSFTVDGETYHMGSYSGCKLMGVKPQSDPTRSAALHQLVQYLTSEECQLQRFEQFSWGPSNLNAQKSDAVKANAALSALAAQNEYATPQGQIPDEWWNIANVLGTNAKEAALNDETALKAALEAYDTAIQAVAEKVDVKTDEELEAWSVIGNIGGSNWDTDLEMVESPDNTWTTKEAYELTADSVFKLRQGGAWSVQIGANDAFCDGGSGNITLETLDATAGRYYIKVVLTVDDSGTITGGTVSLVAAE